jgi:hypothetical protein
MQASAPRTSLLWWTRRCHLPPCPTASRPATTIWLTTGERRPPGGTPAVVATRGPRSIMPRRRPVDNTRVCLGRGASSHAKRRFSTPPWISPAKLQVAAGFCRRTVPPWSMASAPRRVGRTPSSRPWAAALGGRPLAGPGPPGSGSTAGAGGRFPSGERGVAGAQADSPAIGRCARPPKRSSWGGPTGPHHPRASSGR